jgi:hypothetical protein
MLLQWSKSAQILNSFGDVISGDLVAKADEDVERPLEEWTMA